MKEKQKFVPMALVWFERYMDCSRLYGSDQFPHEVWKFYHSLANLGKDKLAIRDITRKYYNDVWYPGFIKEVVAECDRKHISLEGEHDLSNRQFVHGLVMKDHIGRLYEFIIQTIQNAGCAWPTREQFEGYMGVKNE